MPHQPDPRLGLKPLPIVDPARDYAGVVDKAAAPKGSRTMQQIAAARGVTDRLVSQHIRAGAPAYRVPHPEAPCGYRYALMPKAYERWVASRVSATKGGPRAGAGRPRTSGAGSSDAGRAGTAAWMPLDEQKAARSRRRSGAMTRGDADAGRAPAPEPEDAPFAAVLDERPRAAPSEPEPAYGINPLFSRPIESITDADQLSLRHVYEQMLAIRTKRLREEGSLIEARPAQARLAALVAGWRDGLLGAAGPMAAEALKAAGEHPNDPAAAAVAARAALEAGLRRVCAEAALQAAEAIPEPTAADPAAVRRLAEQEAELAGKLARRAKGRA